MRDRSLIMGRRGGGYKREGVGSEVLLLQKKKGGGSSSHTGFEVALTKELEV